VKRLPVIPTIMVVLAVAAMIGLGIWQLQRAQWKEGLIARYGHAPYLSRDFFGRIARSMPEAIVIELAEHEGEPVACSISLRSRDTLYGRYWGASGDFHSLHFELCYYRGIEYCIREGLARFEPGTQGEHKLLRGFLPTPVWSLHEIADERFAADSAALDRMQEAAQIFRRSGVQVELGSDEERRIFAAVVRPERVQSDGNRDAEVERLRKEVARAEGMLENERFVANAPDAVVAAEREKLERYRRELAALEGS